MIKGLYSIFDEWHQEGTVWIISDTHFGDKDLAAACPDRPSDEEFFNMIYPKIGRKDTLIHLGDVGNVEYIQKLRAKHKILIKGNHDAGNVNFEHKSYEKIVYGDHTDKKEKLDLMKEHHPDCVNFYAKHFYEFTEEFKIPIDLLQLRCDNGLFTEIFEGPLIIGEKLILSHEPMDVPGFFNIHGHDHTGESAKNHFNVAGKLINFNQWMKEGHLSKVKTAHRMTIDKATERKRKRGGKKIGEK